MLGWVVAVGCPPMARLDEQCVDEVPTHICFEFCALRYIPWLMALITKRVIVLVIFSYIFFQYS